MRERIRRLKDKLYTMDTRTMFLERLFLMRQAYENYKDNPQPILYAHVLDEILSGISIVIDEDDLIVGRIKETIPTTKDEEALKNIHEYYKTVCPDAVKSRKLNVEDWAYQGMPAEQRRDVFNLIAAPSWFSTIGHIIVSWETLLDKGMNGVKELSEKNLRKIKGKDSESIQKREFLKGVILSCDAVIKYAGRYVEALDELAKKEKDQRRREELLKIRDVCQQVPAHPAKSFHEALQSIWFLDLIMHTVCGARDYTPGRMDQYLYQFYKKDLEGGLLTREDAKELLESFYIHTVEVSSLGDQSHGSSTYAYTTTMPLKRSLCKDSVQYVILGGQTLDGKDLINELSFTILEAADEVRTKTPNIIIRYHKNINRDFWFKACDAMRRAHNNISVYNDETMIKSLVTCGVRLEDAVNYAHYGCNNPAIPNKEGQLREDQRNLAKMVELALNDGLDPVTKIQRGPHTGSVEDFKSFEDFMEAVRTQIRDDVARAVDNRVRHYMSYFAPRPFSFESCLIDDCVEMAMDCNDPRRNPGQGGPGYNHHNFDAGGFATAADSLTAIKKLVYEDKELTLKELRNILLNNYDGHEKLRLKLVNKYPKFGNDDDYVDSIASDIGLTFCKEVVSHNGKNPIIGLCWPQLYTYHRYRSCGLETGATPDGRKAREPVSENQNATNGCDKKGLSALINSLTKLRESFELTPGGGVTITMHPTALMGESGTKVISDVIEDYFERGGMQVQLNVVDKNTLIDAKKHPEKHRDLVVRVTGYSAYFVTLSPESQDNIIARYSHMA